MSPAWLVAVAAWLAVYEMGRSRYQARARAWPAWRRGCWWCAGAALVLVWALAPLAEGARALWAETLQFGVLAFGVAPLAVLATPGALLGRHGPRGRGGDGRLGMLHGTRLWPARGWQARGWQIVALASFLAATIAWRLPSSVDAVAREPALVGAEAASILAGTWLFWVAVAATPPRALLEFRPARVAFAGAGAWSIWIFAYAVGFSGHPFYPAFRAGSNPVTAQEWSVIVLWVTSAIAIVPSAFVNLARWLSADHVVAEAETELFLLRAGSGATAGEQDDGR